jgi:hypothetical protein
VEVLAASKKFGAVLFLFEGFGGGCPDAMKSASVMGSKLAKCISYK